MFLHNVRNQAPQQKMIRLGGWFAANGCSAWRCWRGTVMLPEVCYGSRRLASSTGSLSDTLPQGSHGTKGTRIDIGMGPGVEGLSMNEWSLKKNSNKGPAVSSFFKGKWCLPHQLDIRTARVPGIPAFMTAQIFLGVFTPEECESLIKAVPTHGPGYLGRKEVSELYFDRVVNYRYLTDDKELARIVFERLKSYIPKDLDGGRLVGVNSGFRFVHHDCGGHQAAHIDGREPVDPRYDKALGGYVQSRLSLQMYLNGGYEGGEFVILEPHAGDPVKYTPKYVHKPAAGDAVLFYQERLDPPSEKPYEVYHEALDVTDGNKFACRTMIDYVFPDWDSAKRSDLKDDLEINE